MALLPLIFQAHRGLVLCTNSDIESPVREVHRINVGLAVPIQQAVGMHALALKQLVLVKLAYGIIPTDLKLQHFRWDSGLQSCMGECKASGGQGLTSYIHAAWGKSVDVPFSAAFAPDDDAEAYNLTLK